MKRALITFVIAAFVGPARAQAPAKEIEQAVRDVLYALYSNDVTAFQARILPETGSQDMLGAERFTPEQLQKLRADIDRLTLYRAAAPSLHGRPLTDPSAPYPEGTKAVYSTQFRGVMFVVPMQRDATGWKADVRFWLAMRRQRTVKPQLTDPDIVAKGFLLYILAKKPDELQQFSALPIKGEEYTAANNLPPGDLDHILSLCIEMPVVRARSGERVLLPSGEAAEGGTGDADSLLLIGLMGSVEIPFLMKRIDGAWKVMPQKYFEMLRKTGTL